MRCRPIKSGILSFNALIVAVTLAVLPAGSAVAGGFDQKINSFFTPVAKAFDGLVFYKVSFFGAQVPLVVG